ncbi:hypothetical protein GCM10010435_85200 [Winogradskya consettensis]|uniref:Uncharacterized protein n=1 Tax=Winogradskya consettensis TaxID=113560 RepID=A0A919SL01_9ACTN|nr:hypothetical protein [Actinoplanes consettensis]GIM72618.1 hypothetical protein Aco04nite_31200 [Actinoplanes consettensis]
MTVLILVPAGVLFTRVWSDVSDRRASTKLEQMGVEYLAALAPLVSSLAEAQSSALSGVSDPPVSLTTAVNGVAAVDQRLGGDLRTRDRWTGLRQKIELLPKTTGDPLTVLQAHVEVADLTLALYEAVRDNSELARDPDNDLAHLQEAVGVDLPTTVVEVSRMGDYSQLVAKATATQLAQLSPQFGAAVLAVNTYVNSLTDNLQAAVDNTTSGTLSGSLVSGLDSFRRGVESLTRGANPGGVPNAATMATAQSQLQVSLSNLSTITVREMATLLQDRLDRLAYREAETLAAGVLIALLIIGAVVLPLTGRRRRGRPIHSEAARDVTVGPGDVDTTRREHAGALR